MATNTEAIAKKWYDKGLWSIEKLRELVAAGKLTEEAFTRITGEPYDGIEGD